MVRRYSIVLYALLVAVFVFYAAFTERWMFMLIIAWAGAQCAYAIVESKKEVFFPVKEWAALGGSFLGIAAYVALYLL